MNFRKLQPGASALLLCVSMMASSVALAATQAAKDMNITGPYNSGNLSVFLIHGKDQMKNQTYLTLQEALDQKKVVVRETGNVNQLTVDNLCGSVVFIQSGDIVKGGRQDRTMQNDMLLQPNAKNVQLPAFCVEHGRWSGRGGESNSNFASSGYSISGKELKLAAKKNADQGMVWSQVSENQAKLAQSVAKPVAASASPTSYQLTLENKNVKDATQKVISDLRTVADKDSDVVGYAFAINGKVNSADVYASHDLFKKLWPKLLNSSAVEAVAEGSKKVTKAATSADVRSCIDDADKAEANSKSDARTNEYEVRSQEDAKNILFSTFDRKANVSVHKNYVQK